MISKLFRQRKLSLLLSVGLMLVMMTMTGGVLQAQTPTSAPACAVTPNLLGGQGFSVSGQGFSVSGQGFSVSGQGFSVSGQGFSVSGQGLDPLVVAAEIRDNPVTVGKWVDDRLNFFLTRLGFNTEATAILIVDEFTGDAPHGKIVKQVVDDSLNTLKLREPNLHIDSFEVDISDVNTKYNADAIASKISAMVTSLQPQYHHFVLNMSFGLISCTDPGPIVNGTQLPAFDFNQAATVIAANNQEAPSLAISPVLECVVKKPSDDHGYGRSRVSHPKTGGDYDSYIAYFGYKNENAGLVTIPIGYKNGFSPSPQDQSQPTQFEPGRQKFVFAVTFKSNSTLKWSLKGPDGQSRTATASRYSTPCATPPPAPTQQVTPIVECVADLGSSKFEARFGYNNPNAVGTNIAVGYKNQFMPYPSDRGQVTTFAPGLHQSVFVVPFDGSNLSWKLSGTTVTANQNTTACPKPEGFGVSQYLTQNLGVPSEQVGAYWGQLAGKVTSDEFQGLRQLLRTYLSDSANPSKNFSAVIVASSGNLRPWLGDAPLAPASWKETIAVGATLDDKNDIWSFSQDANVVAPGVGYPLGNNSFAAGTSFAAPAFSVLAGMCATVPNATHFDGVNPPLALDASGNKVFSNALIDTTSLTPFLCAPNRNPTVTAIGDRNDKEGTVVSFQVMANDPDGDTLTYAAPGLPSGISINTQTGLISGTIAANSANTYPIVVTVTDGRIPEGKATTAFTWVVTSGVTAVQIDIRPYSRSNRINLQSRGLVAAAIFGSKTFDATAVDPNTVTLAGAPAVKLFGRIKTLTFDINRDGKMDRILWFQVQKLELTATSTEAVMMGKTYYGASFQGVDIVKIVPPYAPHLHGPSSGASIRNKIVDLTWTDDEDWEVGDNVCYLVQIAKNSNFNNTLQGAIVVDSQSMSTIPLSNGTYYWRVAFSDCSSSEVSPWSDTWSFKVQK